MRKVGFNLENIKRQIAELKGQGVDFEVNMGRKKFVQFSGMIESTYPSVFTVQACDGKLKTYSYSDVLCGDVKILGDEER